MLHALRLASSRAGPRLETEDELLPLAEAALTDSVALRTLLSVLAPHLLRVVRRVIGAGHPDVEDVAQECPNSPYAAVARDRVQNAHR